MPLCLATKHTCLARLASPLLLLKIFALVAAPACGKFDTKEPQLLLTSSESISNDAGNYASPMGFGDIDWQNRSNNYSDAGVFTCKGYTPEKFIEQFSLGLDVLAMRCEGQNDEFRKKNQTPCDFRLCKQDLKPGGRTPPTVDLKIVINSPLGSIPINSSSSSGSNFRFPVSLLPDLAPSSGSPSLFFNMVACSDFIMNRSGSVDDTFKS